ncbi:MAG: SMC family ATPase [Anaerolineae bacterium]|nr:SMC family ATPase [Anaerolineae bacterium]
MLPLRLELRNFLPYRAPDPIVLEGIHLACLTGDNGAGKSSLLDAITWALWGRARARTEGELIHLGTQEMSVQLDFEQEGLPYRVIRRRRGSKKGSGTLDLWVLRPDGTPQLINEPSMLHTQEKINKLLRLTYDTFVHSAFLQQGKADAFTRKKPAERKQILGEILGLETWAVYEDRAKERIKQRDLDIRVIERTLSEIDEELRQEPQRRQEQQTAAAAVEEASRSLQLAEDRRQAVAHAETDLKRDKEALADHERRQREYAADMDSLLVDVAERRQRIADYDTILQDSDLIQSGYAALQQARQVDESLSGKLLTLNDLQGRLNKVEQELQAARARLEQQQHGYQTLIDQPDSRRPDEVAGELARVRDEIARLEAREAERDALYARMNALREERSGHETSLKLLKTEGTDLNERIERLQQAGGAACPLCGQPLTADHRETLTQQLITDRDRRRVDYAAQKERNRAITAELETLDGQMNALADDLKRLPALNSRAGALDSEQKEARARQAQRDAAAVSLNLIRAALAEERFGEELRRQRDELQAQLDEIGYDRGTHHSARDSLKEYQHYEGQHHRLQLAHHALPGERLALDNALARQERLQTSLTREAERSAALKEQIAALELLVQELHRREEDVRRERLREIQARERLTTASQALAALADRRKQRQEKEARREVLKAESALYDDLRRAFSKDGVPAMMIETAIPELETTANDLLARMTDGRMHLKMTTQREKVTGGITETLDIEIADDLGTRAYEMYSGGEAFRIDFAIRIALSKMLARRAGAHLRTLFMDEGFGTQDEDGRSRLVEAINTIQDDFDLILVITHIDDLRDSFPAHIMVEKTPAGSRVSVR